ncbi:hypothetical protein [Actinoplanes friuliensis]|uniref:Integral membrane protein n=1 Tax=Actinoplanes friuliensis DSM 7358 TaxID=1246995 RepID=U5W9F3_9ACTN|nr:hypothetical protein [Actinoplanes friuliensis]AGZ45779.1 hypothetical protein AFR_37625 [Actinoplanes friuliensis DSM 7358]
MTKTLLALHVLAAIVAIGPVTVAASMFPAAARRAASDPGGLPVLRNLHRICRIYAVLGLLVPVLGLATASSLGVLGDAWLITSMVLTVAAAAVLGFLVLPGQSDVLAASPDGALRGAARLGMVTGVFNLLWTVVVVLMVVRPGSTTGA